MELAKLTEGAKYIGEKEVADLTIAAFLADAAHGNIDALYNLGVAFSTGSEGVSCDMVEAHKWFNLAAAKGHEEAAWCRADISDEMTAREIAEAQKLAREWLNVSHCKAA